MSGDGSSEYVAIVPVGYTYNLHYNQGLDW